MNYLLSYEIEESFRVKFKNEENYGHQTVEHHKTFGHVSYLRSYFDVITLEFMLVLH